MLVFLTIQKKVIRPSCSVVDLVIDVNSGRKFLSPKKSQFLEKKQVFDNIFPNNFKMPSKW